MGRTRAETTAGAGKGDELPGPQPETPPLNGPPDQPEPEVDPDPQPEPAKLVTLKAPEGCTSIGGEDDSIQVAKNGTVKVSADVAAELCRHHGFRVVE